MSKEKTFSSEEERLEKIRKRKKDRLYKAERRKDPEFRKRQSEIAKKSYQKRKEKILF